MDNCSLANYWHANFTEWPIKGTEDCLINTGMQVGDYIWKGQGTIGLIILIALALMIFFFRRNRRRQ